MRHNNIYGAHADDSRSRRMRALMDNGDEEQEAERTAAVSPLQNGAQTPQPPPAQPSGSSWPDEGAVAAQQSAAAWEDAAPRSASTNGARVNPADQQWWDDWGSAGGGGRSAQPQPRQTGAGVNRGWGLPFNRSAANGAGAARADGAAAAQPAEDANATSEDGWDADADGDAPDITALTPRERVRSAIMRLATGAWSIVHGS